MLQWPPAHLFCQPVPLEYEVRPRCWDADSSLCMPLMLFHRRHIAAKDLRSYRPSLQLLCSIVYFECHIVVRRNTTTL